MIYQGDSQQIIPSLDAEFHAIVTDPPADIGYLTKDEWRISDRHQLLVNVMALGRIRCVPGAFAFVWSLPRESHKTAIALEEAGWTIKDMVAHHFGTGQPKSGGLKPATELWILAQNGTGRKLNIEECRIPNDGVKPPMKWTQPRGGFWEANPAAKGQLIPSEKGRWPANLIIDEELSDDMPRYFYVNKRPTNRNIGHPTSKAVELMGYLVKLVSYSGELIFDPFAGSGSTGIAAIQNNRKFLGIELNEVYAKLAASRIKSLK